MYKSFKFRLYPNNEQKVLLNKSFGCKRFIYNYYLEKLKKEEYISAYSCIKDYTAFLKNDKPFLQEVDSTLLRKSLFNLEDAYKKYKKSNTGYPKFKSKYDKNSYTTSAIYRNYKDKSYCNIELDLNNRKIKLPKLKWLDIRGYRNIKEIKGKIINATIMREKTGKYYVSILYEMEDKKREVPKTIIGIDLGIKKLLTLSDGIVFENNRYIQKYEKRIKKLQQELARKEKGSNNYNKCKNKLAIVYSKLKNARKYYIHKITKEVTENYDIIACEDLKTKEMIMEKKLSKSLNDATFNEILRQIEYKAKEKGKYFYRINTYYPSSQICSKCDNIDKKYKDLKEREYSCRICGSKIDRDLNASINIMTEGLKMYINKELIAV